MQLLTRIAIWSALLTCLALAQTPLPAPAAAALADAQAKAAEAQAVYPSHFPDQQLWREAFTAAEHAKELAPGRPEPLRFLAQAYTITGWTARAWEAWQEYAALGGSMDASARAAAGSAASKLGFEALSAGNPTRAKTLLSAASDLQPESIDIVAWLGQAELALGNAAEAARLLTRAYPHQPQLEPALERARLGESFGLQAADEFLRGRGLYAQGAFLAAHGAFSQALSTAPSFVEAARGVAASLGALGDKEAALTAWSNVVTMAPNDNEASAAVADLQAQLAPPPSPEPAITETAQSASQPSPSQPSATATSANNPATTGASQEEPGATAQQAPPPSQDTAVASAPVVEAATAPDSAPTQPTAQEPTTPTAATAASAPPAAQPTNPPQQQDPQVQPRPAAAQIGLFDGSLTARSVSNGGQGAFIFLEPPAGVGQRVAAAATVASGALFARVDVSAVPSDAPMQLQLCLVPGDESVVSPPCTDATRMTVTGSGTYSANFDMRSLMNDDTIDWGKGLSRLLLVLRDQTARPLDERYTRNADGSPIDLSPYYPVTLRIRVVLVPGGATFTGW